MTKVKVVKGRSEEEQKDWWDKAAVVSSFLSSVVIAAVGILITASIQRSQIEASDTAEKGRRSDAVERSRSEERAQKRQLFAQLIQDLSDKDAVRRKIAVLLLEQCFDLQQAHERNKFHQVVQVIALKDNDPSVQQTAIQISRTSTNSKTAKAYQDVSRDLEKSPEVRKAAASAAQEIAVRAISGPRMAVFSASADIALEMPSLGGGVFTYALVKALKQMQSEGKDATVEQLGIEVLDDVRSLTEGREIPVIEIQSPREFIIVGDGKQYKRIVAVLVGVNSNSDESLPNVLFSLADVNAVKDCLSSVLHADPSQLVAVVGAGATKNTVLQALDRAVKAADEDTLLIFYYSGHGRLSKDGRGLLMVYDSSLHAEATTLAVEDVRAVLSRSPAKMSMMLLDACFSGAGKGRR